MNPLLLPLLCVLLKSTIISRAAPLAQTEIVPPAGPYIHLTTGDFASATSYTRTNRLVVTYYFYWYDVSTGAHLRNADGSDALTDHPPSTTGFSYRFKDWHRTQLLDMMAAGVDVLLPVFWGAPSERTLNQPPEAQSWSYAGLGPLVQAREELLAEGKQPPRIGMFYDTSTLQYNAWGKHIDLTTDYGRRWFYESIRDFFSLIPPKHWAMIDGQPMIFLYSASFALHHDQSCIDYLRRQFAQDFAERNPFVVREISWQVGSEQVYGWGGALGLKHPGVASLGPGYDHSAVPGRTPLVVSREAGQFYTRNWENFLRRPSSIVALETWNEFHEGTDIAASKEYGRTYIELSRKFTDMFKAGTVLPRLPGPYTDARRLNIWLDSTNREEGLKQFDLADGLTTPMTVADSPCRGGQRASIPGQYIYFKMDDSFKWAPKMDVSVVVEYFDAQPGSLSLEFDGSDQYAPFAGAYSPCATKVALTGTKTWKAATFALTDAVFNNSQNGGADFRLNVGAAEFYVRKVQVLRPGLKVEHYSAQEGLALSVYGESGRRYTLQGSRDLLQWRPITVMRLSDGVAMFTDVAARNNQRGWYRAWPVP